MTTATLGLAGCTPPGPTADYRFANTLASSVGSAGELVPYGSGQTFESETVDGRPWTVRRFPRDTGLILPYNDARVSRTVWSMSVLFRFDAVTGWRRIFGVGDGYDEIGLYVNNGRLTFYPGASGTAAAIAAGTWVQVVLTRDAAGNVTGHVNGAQQFRFTDTSNNAVITFGLSWFIDNIRGCCVDEESSGAVARIRLWDRALSADEVAGLDRLP